MIKSIQWKLVLIHILLILLAMEVVGAYLINSLESYHTQNLSSSLDQRAQLISNFIERYLNPEPMEQEIDYLILEELGRQVGLDIRYTVILDETASVLSSTDATRYPKGEKFLTPEVVQATFGTSSMDIREDTETNTRFMYKAHPVKTGDKVTGIIYLVSSMENIYNTLGDIKTIIFAATLMALPSAIFSNPAIHLSSVVLPHPEGPIMLINSPFFAEKLIPSTPIIFFLFVSYIFLTPTSFISC